ncbi:MAG: hypothetical protein KDN18_20810 [Verrucomicrobiae bacterium]|nr:hypothetical protein [Verrucomicrobiae bacterium]
MPEIVAIKNSRDRESFLRFPWRIYEEDPAWVPPLLSAQRKEIDPERGPFFTDGFGSKAAFFLAKEKGEVLGRIAAVRNERHLARHHDKVGFFGFFESIDDVSVAGALLRRAEEWLMEEGLTVSRGPTSFTLSDACGVTVKGGERRPSVLIGHTPGYYSRLLCENGYHKSRDLLGYELSLEEVETRALRFEEEIAEIERSGIKVRELCMERLDDEAELFAKVFSMSWDRNWGSYPLMPKDFILAAREFGPFFDPRLGAVFSAYGEPAAVFLAVPDVWEIIQKLDGRITPLGALRLWRDRRRISRVRLLIVGILPAYRKLPLAPLMLRQTGLFREAFPGVKTVDFSWILEDNLITRQLAESLGARHLRTQRIYDRELDR